MLNLEHGNCAPTGPLKLPQRPSQLEDFSDKVCIGVRLVHVHNSNSIFYFFSLTVMSKQQHLSSAPPAYTDYSWVAAHRLERFKQICQEHEIGDLFASRLRSLENFDIVLVCDDSGSMRTPVSVPGAFAPAITRWDELKSSVVIVSNIAACLDDDGIDIHFLNRPSLYGVKDTSTIMTAFEPLPSGFTPITSTVTRILQERQQGEKRLLLVIFTDGEPTDVKGTVDIAGLEHLLNRRPTDVFTTLVACTNDDVS